MSQMTTAAGVFEAMKQIIEAKNFDLLQHYQQDFYEYDKKALEHSWHPNAQAIWIVRKNGTHLNFIGYHQKSVDMVEASLSVTEADSYIAHVSSRGIKKITKSEALSLAKKLEFETRNGTLLYRGEPVGSVACELRRELGNLFATVKICMKSLQFNSKSEEKAALLTVAGHEAVAFSQSLFVGLDDVIVNESSLFAQNVTAKA